MKKFKVIDKINQNPIVFAITSGSKVIIKEKLE